MPAFGTQLPLLLLALLATHPGRAEEPARAQSFSVGPAQGVARSAEATLTLDYGLECDSGRRHARAVVSYGGRETWLELFGDAGPVTAFLGPAPGRPRAGDVSYQVAPGCRLSVRSLRVLARPAREAPSWAALARAHAPFLVPRADQLQGADSDLPMGVFYSVHDRTGRDGARRTAIRYTMIFTDEDSQRSVLQTDSQLARYGRRTDIEWLYEVELDDAGHAMARRYQGGLLGGLGHLTRDFAGAYLPDADGRDSAHPVLYNIASHNVFSDRAMDPRQSQGLAGHALAPLRRIEAPEAREAMMFRYPWMFAASDSELAAEGKLGRPSPDFLYVELQGQLRRGSLRGVVTLADGRKLESGDGHGNLDRLGEDLWEHKSFTAIPLGADEVVRLAAGGLHGKFEIAGSLLLDLQLEALRFFVLKAGRRGLATWDVSSFFDCRLDGARTECKF